MSENELAPGRSLRSAVLHRVFARPQPAETGTATASPFLTALWFGFLACGLEAGARLVLDVVDPRVTATLTRINKHWAWMMPVSNLALFAAVGLLLTLAALAWPRLRGRFTLIVLGTLAVSAALLNINGLYGFAGLALSLGVAFRLSPLATNRASGFRKVVHRSLPVLLGAGVVLGGLEYRRVVTAESRALASLPAPTAGVPNVLLLVMDTVRADELSLHGYHRETSPNLTRWASEGVRFDRARSTAPWTLPSHASMFTGRWPHELSVGSDRGLDSTFPTLAEFLASRGYATGGFVGNVSYCNDRYGIDRGFLRYEDIPEKRVVSWVEIARSSELGRRAVALLLNAGIDVPGIISPRKDAAGLNRDLLAWLDGPSARDRPFFAFINYYDAHEPFLLPPGDHPHFGLKPETPDQYTFILEWFRRSKDLRPQADIDMARDSYDDCIAYLDGQIGKLLDELRRRGTLDNTLVVITADHGELFGEHQLFGHGQSLYHPELHVPLIVLKPSAVPKGGVISHAVSLRDVPATIIDLIRPGGTSPIPGSSLARYWGANPAPVDPVLSEVAIRERGAYTQARAPSMLGPMESVVVDEKSYIRNPNGKEELYDLDNDREEMRNIVALPSSRTLLQRYRTELKRLVFPDLPPPKSP